MKLKLKLLLAILVAAMTASTTVAAQAAQKLVSNDDRIKTLVYDPAEVFRIVSRAGFQTTLEFNNDENIETISIGDSIGWQLTPAGRRVFIKPIQKSGITNLSVITNRRSYQFELVATSSSNMNTSHSYVVKFYYPDMGMVSGMADAPVQEDRSRGQLRPVSDNNVIPTIPAPYVPPAPAISSPLPGDMMSPFQAAPVLNYNYTMSGPDSIAPLKIYDNGRSVYFQFGPGATAPQIFSVGYDGQEYPLTVRTENGMAVVDTISPKYGIRQGGDTVYVYNENQQAR